MVRIINLWKKPIDLTHNDAIISLLQLSEANKAKV